MFRKFKFEEPQYLELRSIPLSTRNKFETIGILLETKNWLRLSLEERKVFCHLSIRSQGERDAYREFLALSLRRLGVTLQNMATDTLQFQRLEWENPGKIPARVLETSFRVGTPLRSEDWLSLDDMERYALYQLSTTDDGLFQDAVIEFLKITPRSGLLEQPPIRKSAQGG